MIYKTKPLGALCTYISRGVAPAYCEDGGLPVLNQKCIRGNRIDFAPARCTNPAARRVTPPKYLQRYDVLVNSTGVGTLGRTAQMLQPPGEMTVDSHITILRPAKDLHPPFFGYAVQWRQPQIEGLAEGSTGQTELSRARLQKEILLPVPEKAVQREIADILGAVDAQLDVDARVAHNLQAQTIALYHGRFEPFRREQPVAAPRLPELPEGWHTSEIGKLPLAVTDYVANGSFAALKRNVTHYETPEYAIFVRNIDLKSGEFQRYVDRVAYDYLAKTKLHGGEVLISNVGDVGSVHLCPALGYPMTLGNNLLLLKTLEGVSLNYYLYLYFKSSRGQKQLQSITGGSVQMKFNKTDFRALVIPVPPPGALQRFNETVGELFGEVNRLYLRRCRLKALRDALLDRLMRGALEPGKL